MKATRVAMKATTVATVQMSKCIVHADVMVEKCSYGQLKMVPLFQLFVQMVQLCAHNLNAKRLILDFVQNAQMLT